jgi:hypothetical protein
VRAARSFHRFLLLRPGRSATVSGQPRHSPCPFLTHSRTRNARCSAPRPGVNCAKVRQQVARFDPTLFCLASLRNTSPQCCRSSPYSVFRRRMGMNTTWYLHPDFVWLRLSRLGANHPSMAPGTCSVRLCSCRHGAPCLPPNPLFVSNLGSNSRSYPTQTTTKPTLLSLFPSQARVPKTTPKTSTPLNTHRRLRRGGSPQTEKADSSRPILKGRVFYLPPRTPTETGIAPGATFL